MKINTREKKMSTNDGQYEIILKALRAVGMQTFIQFYYDFKDASISDVELANKIYTENPRAHSEQQRYRIPRARFIFQNGLEINALELISQSKRIPDKVRKEAERIIYKEKTNQNNRKKESDEQIFLSKLNNEIVYSLHNDVVEYSNHPEPAKSSHESIAVHYPRSKTVSRNALKMAEYKCEVDPEHKLFIRKNSDVNYTEPHHLVPLSAYTDFPNINLDREQNVVSLCSNCHNQLHYGKDIEEMLFDLYIKRKDLLITVGIDVSFEQLKDYYK